MRNLAIGLFVLFVAGCSPWTSWINGELEPAEITKIAAPGTVSAGDVISVELTVSQPTSCDTFSHATIERRDDGRLYVIRAFNRVDLSQAGRCALVQSITRTTATLPDAPKGLITLSNENEAIRTTVMVE